MFSTYLGNMVIDHMFRNQAYTSPSAVYVSLHTADPGLTGANEVTGGSYARKPITLGAASSKSSTNSAAVEFTSMPATSVLYGGVWDQGGTTGNFYASGSLSASKIVNSGDTFQFPISNFTITMV